MTAKEMAEKKGEPKKPWGQRIAARRPSVFTTHLKELRQKRGLTQDDVAKGSGVSSATVVDAENGREISLSTALKLARFFEVRVEKAWAELKKVKE